MKSHLGLNNSFGSTTSNGVYRINALIERVKDGWEEYNLIRDKAIIPTFIEEVGSASAENTRTAALKRWACNNRVSFAEWVLEVTDVKLPAEWAIQREYTLFNLDNKPKRIDLAIMHGDKNDDIDLFIESKWKSLPGLDQIRDYAECMTKADINAPLLLLTPVPLLIGNVAELPSQVKQVDWTSLSEFIPPKATGTNLEQDLGRTLFRWTHLKNSVSDFIQGNSNFKMEELSEFMKWIKRVHDKESIEYSRLTPLLILNEVCDQILLENELQNWMKTDIGVGVHGNDCSVDIRLKETGSCFIPIVENPLKGIAVSVRVRIGFKNYSIEVQIGSELVPYQEEKTSDDIRLMFNKAKETRTLLHQKIGDREISKKGNPEVKQRWKLSCSLSSSDLNAMKEDTVRLAAIVEEALTHLH